MGNRNKTAYYFFRNGIDKEEMYYEDVCLSNLMSGSFGNHKRNCPFPTKHGHCPHEGVTLGLRYMAMDLHEMACIDDPVRWESNFEEVIKTMYGPLGFRDLFHAYVFPFYPRCRTLREIIEVSKKEMRLYISGDIDFHLFRYFVTAFRYMGERVDQLKVYQDLRREIEPKTYSHKRKLFIIADNLSKLNNNKYMLSMATGHSLVNPYNLTPYLLNHTDTLSKIRKNIWSIMSSKDTIPLSKLDRRIIDCKRYFFIEPSILHTVHGLTLNRKEVSPNGSKNMIKLLQERKNLKEERYMSLDTLVEVANEVIVND